METVSVPLWVVQGVMGVLLGIAGWFIRRLYVRIDKMAMERQEDREVVIRLEAKQGELVEGLVRIEAGLSDIEKAIREDVKDLHSRINHMRERGGG